MLLTFNVGLWFAGLANDRRPSGVAQSVSPLPAAPTLAELYSLVSALVQCARMAVSMFGQLTTDPPIAIDDVLAYLRLRASADLGKVVNLAHLQWVGQAKHVGFAQAFKIRPEEPELSDVVVHALNEWLLKSGYRGYEWELHDLWKARK
jgi:hypothetical protein